MEQWKTIKGYEGYYQVSNLGRVRSVDRIVRSKGNSMQQRKGRILRPNQDRYGYLKIVLQKNGQKKTKMVHRLVANAFILNPHNYSQINHKDENKTNNKTENLEWCTAKYNLNYGTRTKRTAAKRSKPILQMTPDGQLIEYWPSARVAGQYGFSSSDIAAVCRGRLHIYKGCLWVYANEYKPQNKQLEK